MSRIPIDPGDLEVFLKVAELGGFSRAAEALGMSQPAVTARISRIETRLGQRLLERTTRHVRTTDAGEHFRMRAAMVVQQLRALADEFALAPHLRQASIGVGGHTSIASFVMPELIVGFGQVSPLVRIHLREGSASYLSAELMAQRIELALLGGTGELMPELEIAPLGVEECVLAAHVSHPLVQAPEVDLEKVVNYPFVALNQKVSMWKQIAEEAERRNLTLVTAHEADSLLTLLGLAAAAMGSTLLPVGVSRRLDSRTYGFARIRGIVLTRTINMAKLRHRVLSPSAHAFAEYLRAELRLRYGASA